MEKFRITLNGVVHEVEVERISSDPHVTAPAAASTPTVPVVPAAKTQKKAAADTPAGAQTIQAPMPGKILSVNVTVGQTVKKGDILAILEAMKMANEIMAPIDGTVKELDCSVGQAVSTGDVLAVLG